MSSPTLLGGLRATASGTERVPSTEAAAPPFRLRESPWLAAHQRASREARLGRSRARIGGPWKMREADGEKLEQDFTLIEKKCWGRKGVPELNAGRLNGAGSGQLTMTGDCPHSCECWHPGLPAVVLSPLSVWRSHSRTLLSSCTGLGPRG